MTQSVTDEALPRLYVVDVLAGWCVAVLGAAIGELTLRARPRSW